MPPPQVKESEPVQSGQQEVVQLSLFPIPEEKADKPSRKEAKADKVLEQLRSADLVNMTPMAAMNFLYELKKTTVLLNQDSQGEEAVGRRD